MALRDAEVRVFAAAYPLASIEASGPPGGVRLLSLTPEAVGAIRLQRQHWVWAGESRGFAIEPLQRRFPKVTWLPYDDRERARCIAECDVWLGLGGSPFQIALSRWFVDHLVAEAQLCQSAGKPRYFLGVGVQSPNELADPEVRRLCTHAAGIWTRDDSSAERLRSLPSPPPVRR